MLISTINWNEIDTVLLDMDGTVLDLNFDNTLWTQLLPKRYSQANTISLDKAKNLLFTKMDELQGTLDFYRLDYWESLTKLNICSLHEELSSLIQYRPNANLFIESIRNIEKQVMLVTNADPKSIEIKDKYSKIKSKFHSHISSHHYGFPKENIRFWKMFYERANIEPNRTLLIDDNSKVLETAAEIGIKYAVEIAQPDSTQKTDKKITPSALNNFLEIMPD
tara:strand:+ start:213 stop:878 length:666 start_codon:yes stop_codon:yes gene_type:complete